MSKICQCKNTHVYCLKLCLKCIVKKVHVQAELKDSQQLFYLNRDIVESKILFKISVIKMKTVTFFFEGICLRLDGTGDLNSYNCSSFDTGCPDKVFTDEEIYKCIQPCML